MKTWLFQDSADRSPHRAVPVTIPDEASLRTVLMGFECQKPRILTIGISDNESVELGIGGQWAFVQPAIDRQWNAEVAVPSIKEDASPKPESVWFMDGGDASEIDARFLLPIGDAVDLLATWFCSGKRPEYD